MGVIKFDELKCDKLLSKRKNYFKLFNKVSLIIEIWKYESGVKCFEIYISNKDYSKLDKTEWIGYIHNGCNKCLLKNIDKIKDSFTLDLWIQDNNLNYPKNVNYDKYLKIKN